MLPLLLLLHGTIVAMARAPIDAIGGNNDDALANLQHIVGSLGYLLENSDVAAVQQQQQQLCSSGDTACLLRNMCIAENVSCDAFLRLLKPPPSTMSTGDTSSLVDGKLNLNTIFISVIVFLKCVIVALGSLIAKRYCNDRREARERRRAGSYESVSHHSDAVYKPTTTTIVEMHELNKTEASPSIVKSTASTTV